MMSQEKAIFLLLSAVYLNSVQVWGDEYIAPTLSLESCLRETVTIMITGASSGGLIYTRTTQAYNILPSVDGDIEYTCTFEDCDIAWNRAFQIVVQRQTIIQTRHDIIVTFMCSADLAMIKPADFTSNAGLNGSTAIVTYKPIAKMSLFIDDQPLDSGSYVKLGTEVTMKIEITNNEFGMFDFNVKSCRASEIELIQGKCSLDEELFPNFNKTSIASVSTNFFMFRPTTTYFGAVNIIFSCDLKMCADWCPQVECNDTLEETVLEKREADTPMIVGTMLTVGLEDIIEIIPEHQSNDLCIPTGHVIAVTTTFCIILVSTLSGSYVCYRKRKKSEKEREKPADSNQEIPSSSEKNKDQLMIDPDKKDNKADKTGSATDCQGGFIKGSPLEKGMVDENNSEHTNLAFSSETNSDKTGPIYIDVSHDNDNRLAAADLKRKTKDEINSIVRDAHVQYRSLITATFKEFSSSVQAKLDKPASQPSKTERILAVLKKPSSLKPILKSSTGPKQSVLSKSDEKNSLGNTKDPRGGKSDVNEANDNPQDQEVSSLSKYLSQRRRSSIIKTESRENLLGPKKDK